MSKQPLIVVCGPTASGKTSLSIAIAKALNCEIVSADSMQIYKDMQIATAKPTEKEMDGIKHHLIDFLDNDKSFSVADYVKLAHESIADIASRGKTPLVCGGTGLYINSLIDNLSFDDACSSTPLRDELLEIVKEKGNRYLLEMLREFDPESAERLHENNLNRIIRAIENYKVTGLTMAQTAENSRKVESPYKLCMIGINYRDRENLYDRVNKRVDVMLEEGLLFEAESVFKISDLKTSYQAIGYKELKPYFDGDKTLDECVEKLKLETRHYAKRQLTWFRRDQRINWVYPDDHDDFDSLLTEALKIIDESHILN